MGIKTRVKVTVSFIYEMDSDNYRQIGENGEVVTEAPSVQGCIEYDKQIIREDVTVLGYMIDVAEDLVVDIQAEEMPF